MRPKVALQIKERSSSQEKVDRTYTVDLVGKDGTPHAIVEKLVNVRRVTAYPRASVGTRPKNP